LIQIVGIKEAAAVVAGFATAKTRGVNRVGPRENGKRRRPQRGMPPSGLVKIGNFGLAGFTAQ
jgi:hypothetical protein